jgi:hypothetical protein
MAKRIPINQLTNADIATLDEVVREHHRRRQNSQIRSEQDKPILSSPEVYIAKLPTAGIPARTGTTLGKAVCDIYRTEFGSVTYELAEVLYPNGSNFQQIVYNLSTEVISGEYTVVVKEKYGRYIAGTGGGSIVQLIQCRDVISGTPQTGDLCTATANGFHLGEIVTWNSLTGVFDDSGQCWFRFIDFESVDAGQVIAEYGRNYGPLILAGVAVDDIDGDATELPLYLGEVGEQTFLAKLDADAESGTTIAKGVTRTFSLYHRETEVDSGCNRDAEALNEITEEAEWSVVKRMRNGKWYAWAVESSANPRVITEWFNAGTKDTALTGGRFSQSDDATIYFGKRIGPADCGVTHDPAEAAPKTNGNFTVTTAGLYQVSAYVRVQPHSTSFGGASAGQGAWFRIALRNDPAAGGAIVFVENSRMEGDFAEATEYLGGGNGVISKSTTFLANLEVGDKLHLLCSSFSNPTSLEWTVVDAKISFERLGSVIAEVTIP